LSTTIKDDDENYNYFIETHRPVKSSYLYTYVSINFYKYVITKQNIYNITYVVKIDLLFIYIT